MAGFLGFFNYDKPGRGVDKDAPQKRGFFLFFELYFRKFWRISSLSLFYTLFSVPAFIVYYFLFIFLQGAFFEVQDPALVHWLSIYATVFLVSFIGFAPASMGQAYVLRNFAREDHAWVWDDFWEKTRENLGKGILFFLMDVVVISVLTGAAILYFVHGNILPLPPMACMVCGFFAVFALCFYIMMHFFLYPLAVTMDMKAGTLLKTALQLTLQHLFGSIGIFIFGLLAFGLFLYLVVVNIGFLVLFAALGFSTVAFIYTFYSTSVIDKILSNRENA